jgi:hypothetical protein
MYTVKHLVFCIVLEGEVCAPPPTLQWVVLTGRPILEATTTVKADASSMLKPLDWGTEQSNEVKPICR